MKKGELIFIILCITAIIYVILEAFKRPETNLTNTQDVTKVMIAHPPSPVSSYDPETGIEINDDIVKYDYNVLFNPLVVPRKREPRYIAERYRLLPTVYTRGYPNDTFNWQGYLINKEDINDILKLFGRQKYMGGTEYEYYVMKGLGTFDEMRVELDKQKKELYTDDEVTVDMFGKTYKVYINKNIGEN